MRHRVNVALWGVLDAVTTVDTHRRRVDERGNNTLSTIVWIAIVVVAVLVIGGLLYTALKGSAEKTSCVIEQGAPCQ